MDIVTTDPPPTNIPGVNEVSLRGHDRQTADGALAVQVAPTVPPGTYTVVLKVTTQYPYNKDPKAAQKQPEIALEAQVTVRTGDGVGELVGAE